MSPLLSAGELESLSPVYSICCGDLVSSFTAKKELRTGPAASAEEGSKLTDCIVNSMDKLKDTPCVDIQKEYQECLVDYKYSRIARKSCRPIAMALEECSAKYIGKLD